MIAVLVFAAAPGLAMPATAVAATAGQVYAFGLNRWGELGNNVNAGTNNPNPTPVAVSLPGASGPVVQTAAGEGVSLAVTSTGQLFAWGNNYQGQLGNSTNNGTGTANPPTLVTLPGANDPVLGAATDGGHTLAVTTTGHLYAFGDNSSGALGFTADNQPHPNPVQVSLPGQNGAVVAIASAANDSFAVTESGQLYAWGDNYFGQLGNSTNNGTHNPNPTPTLVSLPSPVMAVAAGDNHTLAITADGNVYAWGENYYGQLGNSTNNYASSANAPVQVALPGATGQAVAISAGFEDSLVLTSTDQLYSFGADNVGQLGIGVEDSNAHPTPAILTLAGEAGSVLQIAATSTHSEVVTSTGQLYGFGYGGDGALANPGLQDELSPTLVSLPGAATVARVAVGGEGAQSLVIISNLGVGTLGLPPATIGAPYSARLQAVGGIPQYSWQVDSLPPGLALNPDTGTISGVPTATGIFGFTASVKDDEAITASAPLAIHVSPPAVTRARVSPSRWSLTGRIVNGHCVAPTRHNASHRACRRPAHLTVRITLTGPAPVVLTLQRMVPGWTVRGQCVPLTPHMHRDCYIARPIPGQVTIQGKAGRNTTTLAGKFAGHRLRAGRYRLTATVGASQVTAAFLISR